MNFCMVALGGAIGAVLRYSIGLIPTKELFPIKTLLINFIGALLIGIIAGYTSNRKANESLILFSKTGLCGGFTTFSTFSLESVNLFENSHTTLGIIYIILSLILCLSGIILGKLISPKI